MESREFGKYTLLEHVGKGGVGSVYRARNERDGATVAVKIFEPAGGRSADLTRRLRDREVRMLVSVQHPNIVKFHETGEVGEEYYYAMEFVENSLLKCLRGGREFRLAEKVRILRQSTSALAAIHHQGIVHRDVKPGNMLLDNGRGGAVHVKLTDLGIARRVRETEIAGGGGDGPVPGTPKYLSPEQIMRVRADGRADIFSLGVVAYELLTGELPFQAETPEEYAEANVEQTQAPAGELAEDLPGFLSDMVDRMLAKDREERYDSDTLEQDLRLAEQHLVSGAPLGENQNPVSIFYGGSPDEQPAESRPWPGGIHPVSWAAALLAVAAAAAAAWAAWPPQAPAAEGAARRPEPEQPSPVEMAVQAAEEGRHRQARAVLQSVSRRETEPERSDEVDAALRRAVEAAARRSYEAGRAMVGQARLREAEVLLRRLRRVTPDSPLTQQLAEELERARRRLSENDRWQRALSRTYELVRKRRYEEALKARRELLEEFASDEEKAQRTRRAIADLLVSWGDYLLETDAPPGKLRELLKRVGGGPQAGADAVRRMAERLRLRLGEEYADRSAWADALEQYALAAEAEGEAVRSEAREKLQEVRRRLAETPIDASEFADRLKARGFASALWVEPSGAANQRIDGADALRMELRPGREAVLRRTLRPVQNLGFAASVEFRVEGRPPEGGAWRAGFAVSDEHNTFRLYFDGSGYSLFSSRRGARTDRALRDAFGDEGDVRHTLGFRYDFDSGRLLVLVDGQEHGSIFIELAEIRLSVFLQGEPGEPVGVSFHSPVFRP